MGIVNKGVDYLRKFGFSATARQVLDKLGRDLLRLPNSVREKFVAARHIEELETVAAGKTVYILIPCIDWSLPLFQRPHQIASILAKRPESLVFFVPDQYRYDNFCFSKKIHDSLYLYSLRCGRSLGSILSGAREVVVMKIWTGHAQLLDQFAYDRLVYEYIDDLDLFYYYNEKMELAHQELMKKADLTVVSADRLYEKAKLVAKRLLICENAGDYAFFAGERGCAVHPLLADKPGEYDCVLGYYGSLAEWFDYGLVGEVAERKPEWLFVLIGYDFDGTAKRLPDLPNILRIEAKPYRELPAFVSAFTIQIIPFLINSITEATSPVKLFEYMASAKPILTSDLPECRKYKSVCRYSGADDFIEKTKFLMTQKDNPDYLGLLENDARENTWDARVDMMLAALEEISRSAD